MEFTLLNYNVLYNKAFLRLDTIIKKYKPDIICLQEVNTDKNNLQKLRAFGYELADYANSFMKFGGIFGVATFYNPKKLTFIRSNSISLSLSVSEMIFTLLQVLLGQKKPKTVLATDFMVKTTKKSLTVCNAHLIFVASNALRLKHIKQALTTIRIKKNSSFIICGDFNYFPYSRRKLETAMRQFDLIEATKNVLPSIKFSKDGKYEQFNFIQRLSTKLINRTRIAKRIKPDYVFYRNLRLFESQSLDVRYSDHFPIVSTFKI